MSTERYLRTGEAASRLGVSRQHVVDMCTQGQLPFVMVGTHRRIPAEAIVALTGGARGRHDDGHSQSSALHAAVVSKLINDPERVLSIARENVRRDYELGDRHSAAYTKEWESVLDVVAVIDTAELPEGWRERLATWTLQSSNPASPKFVEPHDLVLSKLAAGRGKDVVFAAALLDAGLVNLEVLVERAAGLPASGDRVGAWLVAFDFLPTAEAGGFQPGSCCGCSSGGLEQ